MHLAKADTRPPKQPRIASGYPATFTSAALTADEHGRVEVLIRCDLKGSLTLPAFFLTHADARRLRDALTDLLKDE